MPADRQGLGGAHLQTDDGALVLPEHPQLLPTQDVPGTDGGVGAASEGRVTGRVQHKAEHGTRVAPQRLVAAATGHLPYLGRAIRAARHQKPPNLLGTGSPRQVPGSRVGKGQHAVAVAPELLGHLALVHTPGSSCAVIGAAEELVVGDQDPGGRRDRAGVRPRRDAQQAISGSLCPVACVFSEPRELRVGGADFGSHPAPQDPRRPREQQTFMILRFSLRNAKNLSPEIHVCLQPRTLHKVKGSVHTPLLRSFEHPQSSLPRGACKGERQREAAGSGVCHKCGD